MLIIMNINIKTNTNSKLVTMYTIDGEIIIDDFLLHSSSPNFRERMS